ncbi:hypothetical protein D3C87_921590 [compost metagenome]
MIVLDGNSKRFETSLPAVHFRLVLRVKTEMALPHRTVAGDRIVGVGPAGLLRVEDQQHLLPASEEDELPGQPAHHLQPEDIPIKGLGGIEIIGVNRGFHKGGWWAHGFLR